MNNKILYAVLAVIVLLIVGGVVYSQSQNPENPPAPVSQNNNVQDNQQQTAVQEPQVTETPAQSMYSDESTMEDVEAQIYEVSYTGIAFTPNKLTIKAGDIVVFKNSSERNFWPASGPHPQHTNYPEFDAKQSLAPGKLFQFKFSKVGTWPFHDHLNASATGTIIVE